MVSLYISGYDNTSTSHIWNPRNLTCSRLKNLVYSLISKAVCFTYIYWKLFSMSYAYYENLSIPLKKWGSSRCADKGKISDILLTENQIPKYPVIIWYNPIFVENS